VFSKIRVYLFAKGREAEPSDFKALKPEGDSDYGNTPQNSCEKPGQEHPKAAQKKP
jgi:hypothetical protein